MLILMRKFSMVKKLKLTINKDYYSNNDEMGDSLYDNNTEENNIVQSDIQNNILILLNLEWLFQSLVDLEVDLSNDNIIESEINLYRFNLETFAQLIHKDIKITTYQNNPTNKRLYDFTQNSIFSQVYYLDDDEPLIDKLSSSIMNSNLNYSMYSTINSKNDNISSDDKTQIHQNMREFIKKYLYLLEMIIIYGYFIRNMSTIIKT
jgi:hypothetical protein